MSARMLGWASLYLMVVQGTFDRFHHDRDRRHPQHESRRRESVVGGFADDVCWAEAAGNDSRAAERLEDTMSNRSESTMIEIDVVALSPEKGTV